MNLIKKIIVEILLIPEHIWEFPKYIIQSLFRFVPVDQNDGSLLKKNKSQFSITWVGQATVLIQIDGMNILTDPLWIRWLGPFKRYSKPGIEIEHLPPIDVVLISHAHKDHLDIPSLLHLQKKQKINHNTTIIIETSSSRILPKKLKAKRVVKNIGESVVIDNITFHFTPVKHWGSRYLFDVFRKSTGFVIEASNRRIFFPGDTAYFDDLKEIMKQYRVNIALMPIGDYLPRRRRKGVHISPEEVVQFVDESKISLCIPIHWGTFKLSQDDEYEPVETLRRSIENTPLLKKFHILHHGETYWDTDKYHQKSTHIV